MKYQGKKRLYEFLKERGYRVPQMKKMEYERFRGSEWLRYFNISLYAYSKRISVTTYAEDEDGEKEEDEYSVYRGGELIYRKAFGKVFVSQGKEVKRNVGEEAC